MQKSTETLTELRDNKKGFSLIELIVVISMIVALTALGTGGFVTLSHARASKAANSLDALIAQSKVYALSGQENIVVIRYNKDKDADNELKARTYYAYMQDCNTGKILEAAELGNYLLTVEFEPRGGTRTALSEDQSNKIQLKYNMNNGRLEYCWIKAIDGVEASNDYALTAGQVNIHVSFGSDHIVQLYKLTGEHHVVGSDT